MSHLYFGVDHFSILHITLSLMLQWKGRLDKKWNLYYYQLL